MIYVFSTESALHVYILKKKMNITELKTADNIIKMSHRCMMPSNEGFFDREAEQGYNAVLILDDLRNDRYRREKYNANFQPRNALIPRSLSEDIGVNPLVPDPRGFNKHISREYRIREFLNRRLELALYEQRHANRHTK